MSSNLPSHRRLAFPQLTRPDRLVWLNEMGGASVFAREGLLIDCIWLGFIAITFVTAAIWRRRGRKRIAEHPESAEGYRRLTRAFMLWGNLPWVVMGLGLTLGSVDSVGSYLKPADANLWVVAFYLSIAVTWVFGLWWVFRRGGAQQLVDHPGLFNVSLSKPEHVKLIAAAGGLLTLVGMTVFFLDDMPYWTSPGDGYTTVFIVYDGFWRVVAMGLFVVGLGAVGMVVSIIWMRRQVRTPKWWRQKNAARPWVILFVAVVFVLVGGFGFSLRILDSYRFVRAYADGDAQIAEGIVHVLHKQPAGGHAAGDLVEINGVKLRVEYFRFTSAYKRTIAHGGALSEGARVRVWHYDGRVLRVDAPE